MRQQRELFTTTSYTYY